MSSFGSTKISFRLLKVIKYSYENSRKIHKILLRKGPDEWKISGITRLYGNREWEKDNLIHQRIYNCYSRHRDVNDRSNNEYHAYNYMLLLYHTISLTSVKALYFWGFSCTKMIKNMESLKYLFHSGCSSNFHNDALQWAAGNGSMEMILFLMENGYDSELNNDPVLVSAAYNGHTKIVAFLMEKGYNHRYRNDLALRMSAERGHIEMVTYLINKECNPRSDDDYALQMAAKNGHIKMVTLLMKNGCDPRSSNNCALYLAEEYEHHEVTQILQKRIDELNNKN